MSIAFVPVCVMAARCKFVEKQLEDLATRDITASSFVTGKCASMFLSVWAAAGVLCGFCGYDRAPGVPLNGYSSGMPLRAKTPMLIQKMGTRNLPSRLIVSIPLRIACFVLELETSRRSPPR
jgi:hypothetical protein